MIDIAITSRQDLLSIDADLLAEACRRIVAGAGHSQAAISVTLVDDQEMHALNRQHLDHDYPTDVLSFPLSDPGMPLEGEIIASTGTAISIAQDYGNRAEEELLLYVVHGALHLVGFDDKSSAAAKKMREAEAYWLTDLGIPLDRARSLVYPNEPTTCEGEPTR